MVRITANLNSWGGGGGGGDGQGTEMWWRNFMTWNKKRLGHMAKT